MASATSDYKVAAGSKDPEAMAKAQAKIQALADHYNVELAKLNAEAAKSAMTIQKVFVSSITSISSAFDRGFDHWLRFGRRGSRCWRRRGSSNDRISVVRSRRLRGRRSSVWL